MKWMIASDLHGSYDYTHQLFARAAAEGAQKLLLLGDLLYHGPRNDLPCGYAPKKVIELLNGAKNSILCVRGNCEAEVDQMVLTFPVMAEYAYLAIEGAQMYATHGHHACESAPPPLGKGEILLCGHTHIPKLAVYENFVYMNPGSVSIPKDGSCRSYMTLENGLFLWKNLDDGKIYKEYRV